MIAGLLENLFSGAGPLMVGLILDKTGSIRMSIASQALFGLMSLPFVFSINMDVARKQRLEMDVQP